MGIASSTANQQAIPAGDQANAVVSGTFTGTGVSASFMPLGTFNMIIGGSGGPNGNWSATVRLERSFDEGTTWYVCGDPGGTNGQAVYSTANVDVSRVAGEPERGVLYRLNCSAYTSGTINYRLSQSGGGALTFTPHGAP